MKFFNKVKYIKNKLKSKNWVNNRLRYLFKRSEYLNTYYMFECSDFFRGHISASRSRIWYYKTIRKVERQIKFLEKSLKNIK